MFRKIQLYLQTLWSLINLFMERYCRSYQSMSIVLSIQTPSVERGLITMETVIQSSMALMITSFLMISLKRRRSFLKGYWLLSIKGRRREREECDICYYNTLMFRFISRLLKVENTAIEVASDSHRLKVLKLYRHLLKAITVINHPLMYNQKRNELQYMFRTGSQETILNNIDEDIQLAEQVLSKIKAGQYPPFPTVYKDHFADIGGSNMLNFHNTTTRYWFK